MPRTLIPRNLGFTQINFLDPKDVSDAVTSANQILSKIKKKACSKFQENLIYG